jgi:hypothetical protein
MEGVQRGVPTKLDWRVGRRYRVLEDPAREGLCVSVTYWGNARVRWVRLLLDDGSEKSFAPSHIALVG